LTVTAQSIYLKWVKFRFCSARNVIGVQARFVLNLEGCERQVVSFGLAGHEFKFGVDVRDSVGRITVGRYCIDNGDKLGERKWAVSRLALLHTDGVFHACCWRASNKVFGALIRSRTNLTGWFGSGNAGEWLACTSSTEVLIHELVLLNRCQDGNRHAGNSSPVFRTFVQAIVFREGDYLLA